MVQCQRDVAYEWLRDLMGLAFWEELDGEVCSMCGSDEGAVWRDGREWEVCYVDLRSGRGGRD